VTKSFHDIKHIGPHSRPIKLLPGILNNSVTQKNIFSIDGQTRNALLREKFDPEMYAKNMSDLVSRKKDDKNSFDKKSKSFQMSCENHGHRKTKS